MTAPAPKAPFRAQWNPWLSPVDPVYMGSLFNGRVKGDVPVLVVPLTTGAVDDLFTRLVGRLQSAPAAHAALEELGIIQPTEANRGETAKAE